MSAINGNPGWFQAGGEVSGTGIAQACEQFLVVGLAKQT